MNAQIKARAYFDNGFNCAESVLKAVVEEFDGTSAAVPRMATPFGGGVGSSHQEMCGALSGALLALGYMMGRNTEQESSEQVKACAVQLRDWFISEFQSTKCQDIRDLQASVVFPSCSEIVERLTHEMITLLLQKGFHPIAGD